MGKSKKSPEATTLIDYIDRQAQKWNLRVEYKTESSITVWTSPFIGIHIRFWIEKNDLFYFDFYCRTSSWHYNGERTDLHDAFSLFFAIYLKRLSICSTKIVSILNPATDSDSEIYGNYIIPIQIDPSLIDIKTLDRKRLDDLVGSLFTFEKYIWGKYNGCPCKECKERLGYTFDYRWEGVNVKQFEKLKSIIGFNVRVNYIERTLPTWFYYRNFKNQISVIESAEIIEFISALAVSDEKKVEGINGDLVQSLNFCHFFELKTKRKIFKHFKSLEGIEPTILFLENKIIGIGEKYILSIDRECGFNEFKTEREKVRERHNAEFDMLFQPSKLVWAPIVKDEVFENLIKDLLEREPNVSRVRKLAHTRERDAGVDLVAEWHIPKGEIAPGEDPYFKLNVIVQCKAYKSGVGKSDVQDIRDTVEHRNYDGYFLATSSYTKMSLSDHLDKLRVSGKLWIDWWTSSEIEERLRKHENLIRKYRHILSFETS